MNELLLACACVAALVSSAAAQAGPSLMPGAFGSRFYVSGGLGVFDLSDDLVTSEFGETTNLTDPGIAFFALFGHRLSEVVAIEGELGVYNSDWDGFADGSVAFTCPPGEECFDEKIQTTSLTANIVLSAPQEVWLRPYVGAGAGIVSTDYNLEAVDSDTDVGYILKAGFDAPIAPGIRLGLQYTYLGAPGVEFDDIFTFETAGQTLFVTLTGNL